MRCSFLRGVGVRLLSLLRRWLLPLALCGGMVAVAQALPREARVPGGVAVLPLGVVAEMPAPRAWLGDQPVWVTHHHGQWQAVIGIGLETPPGTQTLRVLSGNTESQLAFSVADKAYPEQHIRLKDQGQVQLSPENSLRVIGEVAQIQDLKRHWRESTGTRGDFLLPAAGRLSGRFGLRRVFNGEPRAPHSGLDIAVARGTPVQATAAGQVLATGDFFFNGLTVFLDHGNGLVSMYCHLDQLEVTAGETVAAGQRIALSGMSGRASGPHLHWSVILNGTMVDPALVLPAPGLQKTSSSRR